MLGFQFRSQCIQPQTYFRMFCKKMFHLLRPKAWLRSSNTHRFIHRFPMPKLFGWARSALSAKRWPNRRSTTGWCWKNIKRHGRPWALPWPALGLSRLPCIRALSPRRWPAWELSSSCRWALWGLCAAPFPLAWWPPTKRLKTRSTNIRARACWPPSNTRQSMSLFPKAFDNNSISDAEFKVITREVKKYRKNTKGGLAVC